MDEKIKQRVAGTVVMTALLAIFLPMLFDDPVERSSRSISEMQIPDLPIQLQTPVQSAPTSTEQVLQAPVNVQPKAQVAVKSNTSSDKSAGNTEKLVRWVVQVGSFKSHENALAERDKLRNQGFTAFVESFNDMFRVRIGPELDKSRAEKIKKTLEQKNNIKTMLVPE